MVQTWFMMTDSQSGSAASWTFQSPSPEPQMQDSSWTPSQNRTLQPLGVPLPSRKREADGSRERKARRIRESPAPRSPQAPSPCDTREGNSPSICPDHESLPSLADSGANADVDSILRDGTSSAVDRSSANSPEAMKDSWKITLTPPNTQETNAVPPGSSLCRNSLQWPAYTRANAESAYQKLLNQVRCMNEDVDKRLEAARERPREICDGLYEVGGKIGEGSFGVVFEGIMRFKQKEVAIKFVSIPSFPEEQRSYIAGTTKPRTTTRRVSYV